MTLVTILFGLFLERVLLPLQWLRRPRWFERYAAWLRQALGEHLCQGTAGVLLILIPPLLLVGLVSWGLDMRLSGLPALLFGLLVFLFALGPRDLDVEVESYLKARDAGDQAGEAAAAEALLGAVPPEPAGERERALVDSVLVQSNLRVFGVMFWFALAGPLGAVLFRLAAELADWAMRGPGGELALAASRLRWLLAWLPAHLAALSFAVTGDFEKTVMAWRDCHRRGGAPIADANAGVLIYSGNAALGLPPEGAAPDDGSDWVRVALGLVWRAVIAWMTVIALLVISGLAG